MKIAIAGTGNVGGTLAKAWAKKGHQIYLAVRDTTNFKGRQLLEEAGIEAFEMKTAAQQADVILIAAHSPFTQSILEAMGDVSGKVIIDAMNSVFESPKGYDTSFDAIKDLAPKAELVKCFNSTGFENMRDPIYHGEGIDMFMAGDSTEAKQVAAQLAEDAGFGMCYDFGGDQQAGLLEQFARSWINLAIAQGHGRDIAFRVVRRS